MIKLLLVDDEPLVLVGLQTMLPWEDYGIEICGTARSGAQALDIISQRRPDIVITDIMMPVHGGLELMENCRKKYGRLPLFIILTCVEEFQHVKQAMRNQAVDYLVKLELTPEILSQSIKKAIDILEGLGKKPGEGFAIQAFYDRFFTDLFNSRFENEEQFEAKQAELGIDFTSDAYIVCYCELDKLGHDDTNTQQLMSLHTSATRMAWETISKQMPCYITSLDLHQFTITFCINEPESKGHQQVLSSIMGQTIEITQKYFNVGLTCCFGVMVSSPILISDSFYTARISITAQDRAKPIHFHSMKTNADNIVEQVKDYIRQNIEKRLGLNQVADVFGFSPKYISALFAKHAECSFVEYVNAGKINLAREMLLANDAKVYEVSEKLGFDTSFYFSKVFKKHTGLSPREYMRKYI